MFVGKTVAYLSGQVFQSRVGSWPYLKTLDYTGKACQGETLA